MPGPVEIVRVTSDQGAAEEVARELSGTPGVTKCAVELQGERATVEYDTSMVKPDVLKNAVRDLGYEVA